MLVPDVNVLLNAVHEDSVTHGVAEAWLGNTGNGIETVGIPDLVLSAFVRIATNARMSTLALPVTEVFRLCDEFRAMPAYERLEAGPNHWATFQDLVFRTGVAGPDIADAYLAAFAVENNATFVTFDMGFSRFPGLKLLSLQP